MELDRLRDPQRLAVAAKALGMVAPSQPAFVRLSDGTSPRQAHAGLPRRCRAAQPAARPACRRRSSGGRSS